MTRPVWSFRLVREIIGCIAMETFDFDLFVSHASEDKNRFVRPLVAALEDAHLSVWYDEAELQPGESLIQSVERGLATSRFGAIVLSPAFFAKRWPRRELDALTSRELATGESVLLPIWLDVDEAEVRRYSPLLADRFAIVANRGLPYTATRVIRAVRPGKSPLVIARERLSEYGVATPPPADPWWLDTIESAAELEGEDGFQGAMLWPRWSFPLPPKSHEPEKRATRLAQAVLRDAWVAEADLRPITQITEPGVVHEFIAEMPGLAETCSEHPSYLGAYAPQLLLPGFGGDFELLFDDWLAYARERGRDSDTVALHAPEFAGEDPATVVCTFVQGEINGPPVRYYEPADYLFWLLSEQSGWLPATVRETFLAGFRDWPAWLPWRRGGDDAFVQQLSRSRGGPVPKLEPEALAALETRASEAVVDLDLPEQGDDLAERLLASGVVEGYVRINRGRRS